MNEQNFSPEIINKKTEKAKLPRILWALEFNSWDEFQQRVKEERIVQKQENERGKKVLSAICRKIIGEKWISDGEYRELSELVEKELDKIEKIIDDARKVEDNLDVESLIIPETPGEYKKRIITSERILRDDHEI